MPRHHRKPTLILGLVVWLIATGGHWDFVQVYGWARMFADNLQTMPALQAVRQTFSPTELCGICQTVGEAKRDQDNSGSGVTQTISKAPLVFQAVGRLFVEAPVVTKGVVAELTVPERLRAAPPVPPPRGVVV